MEALENLAYKFKIIPLWKRLIMLVFVPVLWAGGEVFTTLEELSQQVAGLKDENIAIATKLQRYKDKQKNIDTLRKKLKLTQAQLGEAQKVFPDEYNLDVRLNEIANIAARTGAQIQSFIPGAKSQKGEAVKWEEYTLKVSLIGSYMQIALFFDSVNHLPTLIRTRSMKLVSYLPKEMTYPADEFEAASKLREDAQIKVDAELTLYRALDNYVADMNPADAGGIPSDQQGNTAELQPDAGAH